MEPGTVATVDLSCVLGILVVVVFVAILIAAATAKSTEPEFGRAVAERLNGRFIRWIPPGPRIEFSIAGNEACLIFVAGSETGRTRLTVPFPSPGTFQILPFNFIQSFLKRLRAPGPNVGDEAFDADYAVQAAPESLAARVFSSGTRERAIAAVRRLEGMSCPAINLTLTELSIQVEEDKGNLDDVLRLVRTAEDLLRILEDLPAFTGIDLGDLRLTAGACCPVCGATLDGGFVRCESCAMPHHTECWSYAGHCATYACRGKRSIA